MNQSFFELSFNSAARRLFDKYPNIERRPILVRPVAVRFGNGGSNKLPQPSHYYLTCPERHASEQCGGLPGHHNFVTYCVANIKMTSNQMGRVLRSHSLAVPTEAPSYGVLQISYLFIQVLEIDKSSRFVGSAAPVRCLSKGRMFSMKRRPTVA
jgi:hypothetical protein